MWDSCLSTRALGENIIYSVHLELRNSSCFDAGWDYIKATDEKLATFLQKILEFILYLCSEYFVWEAVYLPSILMDITNCSLLPFRAPGTNKGSSKKGQWAKQKSVGTQGAILSFTHYFPVETGLQLSFAPTFLVFLGLVLRVSPSCFFSSHQVPFHSLYSSFYLTQANLAFKT